MPLARGLGRSYGDSSLPAPRDRQVASATLADRILSFDPETGILRAEAGLSLSDLYRLFLPRGWFVPVTPGHAVRDAWAGWWRPTFTAGITTATAASAGTSRACACGSPTAASSTARGARSPICSARRWAAWA